MGRTFAIGDIHGCAKALEQVLERSGFDKENDTLITLGDICDGWPYVYECVDILLTIKDRIDIMGNHDEWFRHWLNSGTHPDFWIQGGTGTLNSYLRKLENGMLHGHSYSGYTSNLNVADIPVEHWKFFMHQNLYYKDDSRNFLFVHAGFDRWEKVSEIRGYNPQSFYWDRELWSQAKSCANTQKLKTVDDFDKIFIGHTAIKDAIPMYKGGVWNLDTGAGWRGKLTIMNIDTEEYWQSDQVESLYPDDVARRK